jgi:hypothetical protein
MRRYLTAAFWMCFAVLGAFVVAYALFLAGVG